MLYKKLFSQNTRLHVQVGLEKMATEHTRLIYMTTGVLLQKLVLVKSLTEFSHIFIDEVTDTHTHTLELHWLVDKAPNIDNKIYGDEYSCFCTVYQLPLFKSLSYIIHVVIGSNMVETLNLI